MEIENTLISQDTFIMEYNQHSFVVESDKKLIELFMKHRSSKGSKANKTIEAYYRDIHSFLQFLEVATGLENFPLKQVHYGMCISYIDWLQRKIVVDKNGQTETTQYSNSTISRRVKTMKALYTFGMNTGYFSTTPWILVQTPHANPTGKKTHRILTMEEIEQIQTVAKENPKWDAICSWFLSTACRREELVQAHWCDLRKEETISKGARVIWHVFGKGNKEDDLVIHPSTLEKVVQYRRLEGLSIQIGNGDESPIFCSSDDKPYSLSGISKLIKTIGTRANVPGLSPHWFRHTHATYALMDGSDVYKVKQQLRHSDLKTTEMYLHDLDKYENVTVDTIKRIQF